MDIYKVLLSSTWGLNSIDVSWGSILAATLILVIAKVFLFVLFKAVLRPIFRKRQIDQGRLFSVQQLVKYFVYTFAIIAALGEIGVNVSYILAGSAALLVGIGLGLQQTFNDFISGLILLFEGSISKGDIVELDSLVGKVQRIGLRSSKIETRDGITMVVPNSKLVVDNVINWSHENSKVTRFSVSVGVAYGSNVALVISLLTQAAQQHKSVLSHPPPNVQFKDFGDSSLQFDLLFWTSKLLPIEDIKSDLRIEIDRLFRDKEIEIPFPQRDVHIKDNKNL